MRKKMKSFGGMRRKMSLHNVILSFLLIEKKVTKKRSRLSIKLLKMFESSLSEKNSLSNSNGIKDSLRSDSFSLSDGTFEFKHFLNTILLNAG